MKVNLAAGQNFSTQKGNNAANLKNYTVITSLGAPGDATVAPAVMTLQGINTALAGNYVLGADIDASVTSGWNGGAGFRPIGAYPVGFTGVFSGLGHTVSSLKINTDIKDVGLFSNLTGNQAVVRDIGLLNPAVSTSLGSGAFTGALVGFIENGGTIFNSYVSGGSVTGDNDVGGLVGANNGTISNSYAAVDVTGNSTVGGFVGNNFGIISNSYATGNVTGNDAVGGLLGLNGLNVSVNNAYATGSVTGNNNVGGLVGFNDGTIKNTYTTGKVSGSTNVGGLIGFYSSGTVGSSFWDTVTTTQTNGVGLSLVTTAGVTGKTTSEMKRMATFSSAGWDIADKGGTTAVWRIYEGSTTPLLRSFLKPLTISNDGTTTTYSIPGANTSGHLFGTGLTTYSDQQGYDISFVTSTPPVIKPSDDVDHHEHNNIFVSIDVNIFLPQITQLQISTTFLEHLKSLLIRFDDDVDAEYGQFKGNNGSTTPVTYSQHREYGKRHWYEKQDIKLKNILYGLLYLVENGGIKLSNELMKFISNANANSDLPGVSGSTGAVGAGGSTGTIGASDPGNHGKNSGNSHGSHKHSKNTHKRHNYRHH